MVSLKTFFHSIYDGRIVLKKEAARILEEKGIRYKPMGEHLVLVLDDVPELQEKKREFQRKIMGGNKKYYGAPSDHVVLQTVVLQKNKKQKTQSESHYFHTTKSSTTKCSIIEKILENPRLREIASRTRKQKRTTVTSIRIDAELWDLFKKEIEQTNNTVQEIIEDLILLYLNERHKIKEELRDAGGQVDR